MAATSPASLEQVDLDNELFVLRVRSHAAGTDEARVNLLNWLVWLLVKFEDQAPADPRKCDVYELYIDLLLDLHDHPATRNVMARYRAFVKRYALSRDLPARADQFGAWVERRLAADEVTDRPVRRQSVTDLALLVRVRADATYLWDVATDAVAAMRAQKRYGLLYNLQSTVDPNSPAAIDILCRLVVLHVRLYRLRPRTDRLHLDHAVEAATMAYERSWAVLGPDHKVTHHCCCVLDNVKIIGRPLAPE